MSHNITIYLVSLFAYVGIDYVWLNFAAKKFYQEHIPDLKINFQAGIVVYLLGALLMTVFLAPKVAGKGVMESFLWGALLGALVYGIYDFTNLATLKHWSLKLSIIDMLWGTFAFGILGIILSKL